ncbi:MAG: flagellar biosynthesis protein FlhB [Lachnospiraceae bacterium]|nr:flagellar biosynthesis protein FlhB [Lachnospiraceae bacterium]
MLKYNLQFFAKDGPGGERTEPATAKKLRDARKKGQVAKSKEVANGTCLLALFLMLKIWIGNTGNGLLEMFPTIYNRIPEFSKNYDGEIPFRSILYALQISVVQIILISAPFLLVGLVLAFVSDLIQVKWQPTTETMKPKFDKLNPVSGFKRFFSLSSLVELLKSLLKIGVIVYVSYSYLKDQWQSLYVLYGISLTQAIGLIGEMVVDLGIRISVVYMLIVVGDFAYQKWKFKEDMKMSKQEIKDEYKQDEGDPQIKGKIRQKMREASMRRMMQNIPKADVIITNPTHYAVAIKYDPEQYDAPFVVAKGADHLARRIKEIGRENRVEIVENKPLARMLYANVDIGQVIPPELYQAVAEVLAFVYNLKGRA